jgi:hypothetical protein
MPRRIGIVYRVIPAVAVAVEALRVIGRLDNAIRSYKSPYLRIVIPCPVVVEPGTCV